MTRLMTTTNGGVAVNTFSHKHFFNDSPDFGSPENWDDDFEFQAQENGRATESVSASVHASGSKHRLQESEESWDDAYADDDGPASPPRRVPKTHVDDDEEIEDWDSSDNEIEDPQSSSAREFGNGAFEEEDKTVTARSTTSSRFRSPPPPLPIPPPPAINVPLNMPTQDAVFPVSIASPTLSTFSIPVSSNRDHSVYSHEGLIRNSSGSAPHLTIMRSYPHGAGSTPPRKGRRLRKKSRPPEVDIIELEDCDPASGTFNNRPAAFPQSTPAPDNPETTSQLPISPSNPSLLTRIGSFKRWTRRSIGPEDVTFSGWRRTKSSFGPSDVPAFDPSTETTSSVGNPSTTSPIALPSQKNRTRGSSASGLKSGWFFRSGGAGDVETTPVPPKSNPTTKSSSPPISQHDMFPELRDRISPEPLSLTPRRSKSRLVPILKSPLKKKQDSLEEQLESNGVPDSGHESSLKTSKRNDYHFPRYSASVGRQTGSSLFADIIDKGASKERDVGVRGLVKGVRRLSQVGISGHKHNKSIGKTNDEAGTSSEVAQPLTSAPLLPPVELNSPILASAVFSRRGSLPQADFAFVLPANGYDQPTYTLSPTPPLENGMSMERMSFSSSRAGSRLDTIDKHPTGSPPRPKPNRRATSPLPAVPPSPPRHNYRPESVMSNKRPGSATSTRRPGSSSSSCPPVSAQAQALAAFRPRTPVRNQPPIVVVPSGRPRTPTPNKLQGGTGSPQTSTAPSAYTASLGRTATPPQLSKSSLKRNSLNDLRSATPSKPASIPDPTSSLSLSDNHSNGEIKEHKSLDQRRASTNTLSELKIPTRISKIQHGLRRDLGLLREFAGYVEELRRLQKSYMKLIGELCVVYESYPVYHVPSRPPSQLGISRKSFTSNSNASTQSIQRLPSQPTSMLLNSPTKAHATRNYSRSSNELSRELSRLDQEYGLWWECAELLVELGGGSSSMAAASASASNPNLTSHSSSSALSTNTTYDDPPPVPKRHSKMGSHAPSMSDPGSVFYASASTDPNKTSSEASPPQQQWRSSTGRHDLSSRQLRLLRDMLNTPDPSTLPDNPSYFTAKSEAWNGRNPSALTLPSDESFMDQNGEPAAEKNKEKKRRLGIIDFLRGMRKAAIAEGRLAPRSESSLSSHSHTDADDDHYNRRRSPWHQHNNNHHVHEQLPRMPAAKSPSRPSLASIFRIGGKDKGSKVDSAKAKKQPSRDARKVSAEDSAIGDADDEHGDRDDWERMSQSELDLTNLTNIGNGTNTIRGRKSKKSSLPSMHPYSVQGATTPKKTPTVSRVSLLEPVLPFTGGGNATSKPSKHKLRTSSWSQTHVPHSSAVNGKGPVSGTVRSAPPADVNAPLDPKLTLSPENIKPLLEYAKEVSVRLGECITEVHSLLGQRA